MPASEDFWDDILGHLKDRVLLPVVGPELVTVQDGDRRVSLSRLLGERVAARYQLDVGWGPLSGLDDAVGAFLAARGSREAERLYRVVNDFVSDLDPQPPEALRQLAGIRDFRLFLSTTFDPLLARALNEVRFGGEARTRELWFSPNQSTSEQQENAREPREADTVVFKLFGKASSTPQYAIHDEDVLEWLHVLLTETARLPEWLAGELKASPVLFLGCQLSDWIGRLLTRMASKSRLSLESKQFFIVGESVAQYPALTRFFQTFCGGTRVQVLEADPAVFVAELSERWHKRNPQAAAAAGIAQAAPSAGKGSIFISYVREDADAARRLCDALAEIGGDVWLDERRLQPGDRWEEEILASIRREVRLFLPVISRHTESREEGYVFKEWREAVERAKGIPPGGRRFIFPVVIDAEYDGNPSRYRQVPDAFTVSHWGRAPGGDPDEGLVSALRDAIRDMRRPMEHK
ncbi:MAG TPA: toll/interleukin-1 receptor domain-containing protein [Thermoanaerobaculia bacterium]|nr:toll/interleukin-1 receptor domain-containing protein [Thermoanaerobaculia bacterium]